MSLGPIFINSGQGHFAKLDHSANYVLDHILGKEMMKISDKWLIVDKMGSFTQIMNFFTRELKHICQRWAKNCDDLYLIPILSLVFLLFVRIWHV